ncbi:MAG: hypothetical protein FWG65_04745 [Turicibacter sp.]|nr:hypothetical protein [Turicibacter sp.]
MRHLEILTKKLEIMGKMLSATERLKLTAVGERENLEREAELFSSLYEQRADAIARIKRLDEELAALGEAAGEAELGLLQKISDVAERLIELDKLHAKKSEQLMAFLKGNLKTIRVGRGVADAYDAYGDGDGTGYYLDRKR